MEEWSNLIWVGGAIADCGPVTFQALWAHMFKFLQHYLYGVDAWSILEQHAAHEELQKYARFLEELAVNQQVRFICIMPGGQLRPCDSLAWSDRIDCCGRTQAQHCRLQ